MAKKKNHTQERLEAKVIHKFQGKIDLAKLWEEEADPKKIEELRRDALKNAEIQSDSTS